MTPFKFHRLERKLPQRAIAKIAHINRATVSLIDNGIMTPGIGIQIRLARASQVSRDELFPVQEQPINESILLGRQGIDRGEK